VNLTKSNRNLWIAVNGLALCTIALIAGACADGVSPTADNPIIELPRALTEAEKGVLTRSNSFGFDLLEEVVDDDSRPNLILSPFSASMALGMTLNGSAGGTFDAMSAALGFEGMQQAEINAGYRGLLDLLSDLDPEVSFDVANGIWANESFTFHQEFFDEVNSAFNAKVVSADFGQPSTLSDINGWVNEETSGRIKKIVDSLDPNQVMILLNAINFDGSWRTRFDPEETATRDFTRPDGSRVPVQMMELSGETFLTGGGEGYSVVELPYGGGAFSMVLALPWDGDVRSLVDELDADEWNRVLASMDSTKVDLLGIPKLKVAYDVFLNDALTEMGMGVAFGPAADFSAMSPQGLEFCIDWVRQKTFMEVDEAGTRAAAVTGVGIGVTSFNSMVADRPFLLSIRERNSGAILFLGIIEDPTAEAEAAEALNSTCG